ncbi:hypothetical protein BU25DRAFT_422163 [Macroventuria anomochaeta]|uniref:Uncharacterized protein n=1 Tax=Macroventuria anomochaeta TaxID=301207 RepID=A0ACB6RY74_9PLEO|nr:uncharacterized protein BU25DRAFT_422163 [Macroventuria anomochaeta]KAF2626821.1 hypothetical protein BU25DRAFT_422163 [Macroventuria anomochaeta]
MEIEAAVARVQTDESDEVDEHLNHAPALEHGRQNRGAYLSSALSRAYQWRSQAAVRPVLSSPPLQPRGCGRSLIAALDSRALRLETSSPSAAMPALLVNTDLRPASSSDISSTSGASQKRSESPTSDRPPVSPITPTGTVAQLAPIERSDSRPRNEPPPRPVPAPTTFRQQPPSVPISESENPDAIALRSAISLLQIQREKSKRDLKALEELKHAAVQDPESFMRSLQEQRVEAARAHSDVLTPTLAGLTDLAERHDDDTTASQPYGAGRKDSANVDSKAAPRFPAIPQPQNIVRCPPIEWTKYHIVGEPLNKMHEEQKKWPGSSEPPKLANGHRAPPHSVTAPYSPFKDAVSKSKSPSTGPPSKTKKMPS